MNKFEYIWLSNIDISNENKFRLINAFGNVENLYKSNLDDLIYLGVKDDISYKILNSYTKEKAKYDFEYMNRNNINLICFEDEEYPEKFKIIKNKPISFYIKGDEKILRKQSIGIVGSRIALKESLEIARLVANAFSCKGVNVISGLAKGIDKYAHLGALDAFESEFFKKYDNMIESNLIEKNGNVIENSEQNELGKTIGILACGLDKKSFYPKENFKVYERIVKQGGAVISEYSFGTIPKSYYFPHRNRLISGLSDKIFVVQASSLKSGSLITVDYALEQGKDVYVYKSKNLGSSYFEGNRLLIEEGAKIFKI